jgi:hypothetical protein
VVFGFRLNHTTFLPIEKRYFAGFRNESVAADADFIGVRPSSRAASWKVGEATMNSDASAGPELAAPEDGRAEAVSHRQ